MGESRSAPAALTSIAGDRDAALSSDPMGRRRACRSSVSGGSRVVLLVPFFVRSMSFHIVRSLFALLLLAEKRTRNTLSRRPPDEELGDKLRILNAAPGSIHRLRHMGEEAACIGNTLRSEACMDVGAPGG